MGSFKNTIITKKGHNLMAKLTAGTVEMNFTKIRSSEHDYSALTSAELETLTEIQDIKQEITISEVKRINDASVKVSGALTNISLTEGYYLKTIALYVNDPDEGEILYSVTPSILFDWMPPNNGVTSSSVLVDLITVVSNSDNVTIDVDPNATATVTQLKELDEKLSAQMSEIEQQQTIQNNNISNLDDDKANKIDLNSEIDDRKNAVNSVQGQINSLILGAVGDGNNPEVIQSRTDSFGIQFNTVKTHLDSIEKMILDGYRILEYNWVIGGINSSNGEDADGANYAARTSYVKFNDNPIIYFQDFITVWVIIYDENKSFVKQELPNRNQIYNISKEYYYRFVIFKSDKSDISNASELYSNFSIAVESTNKELKDSRGNYAKLPDRLDDYDNKIDLLLNNSFFIGGINSSNGEDVDIKYAVRSNFLRLDGNIHLSIKNELSYYVVIYDINKTFVKLIIENKDIDLYFDKKYYYRFVVYDNNAKDKILTIDEIKKYNDSLVISYLSNSVLCKKTINCLGDSITSINYTRPNWWEQIATRTDAKFNNYGISGTTLAHTDDRHLWDYDFGRLDATTIGYNENDSSTWSTGNCMCERYIKLDTNADGVILMGGTNDYAVPLGEWNSSDISTFYGALNAILPGLLKMFPGKPIMVCTMIQSADACSKNVLNPLKELEEKEVTANLTLQLRSEAIKAKCRQYGIYCLDLYNIAGINGNDTDKVYYRPDDNLHPSAIGQARMSNLIQHELEKLFNTQ